MNLGVTGIVINGFDQILLIQRDDTKTWAPPAGAMELDELPTEAVIREVREETGLKIMPVRLVAIHYRKLGRQAGLQFVYRCLEAGGEITPSPESPQVGYVQTKQLPRKMLSLSRDQVEQAVGHTGQAIWKTVPISIWLKLRIIWLRLVVYPRLARERKARGDAPYVPAPGFTVSVAVGVRDEQNNLMWANQSGKPEFPVHVSPENKAPWEFAADIAEAQFGRPVEISRIAAIYIKKGAAEAVILWEGKTTGSDGVAEIPADADDQSRRFAEELLANNDLVTTDWL